MTEIKKLILASKFKEALDLLDLELKNPYKKSDHNFLLNHGQLLKKIPSVIFKERGLLTKKIAVLGGYTTEFLTPALRVNLYLRGIHAEVFEGEYGTLESSIRSRNSELFEFNPDLVYFCVGTQHVNFSNFESEVIRWQTLWMELRNLIPAQIIMNLFVEPIKRPFGHFELKVKSDTQFIRNLNAALTKVAPNYVHFCDMNYVSAYHGKSRWFDYKLYDLVKVPVGYEFLADYADHVSRVASSIWGKSKKCLILDLDNTLWGGVIGDDGLGGICIGEDSGPGEAFKRFQIYLKKLKERGVILAVCSKNELENAKEPFERRTDMVLRLDDFSAFYANWNPKHQNISAIADELNIGLDSIVFVDDNPAEREIVRQNLPMVTVVDIPEDPAFYTLILDQMGLFETVAMTEEDSDRTEQYLANRKRASLVDQVGNYDDYLKSLQMTSVLEEFDFSNLPRIAQLINKTNQFNLTTKRYTELDVESFQKSKKYFTAYVKLKDRFGDNGLISVLIIRKLDNDNAEIDTWLMSCRVLKREVETFLFQHLVRSLIEQGVRKLFGYFVPTEKNKMVKDLLIKMNMALVKENEDGMLEFVLDLTDNQKVSNILSRPVYIQQVSSESY
jgi:FkbH-like protein